MIRILIADDHPIVRQGLRRILSEETDMPDDEVGRRVDDVLGFVGLREFTDRLPSELSGGQRRRVALARAMAAKPSLLLLDDPTTGLDQIVATTVDDEIVKLRDLEQVTALVVTHQMRDAFYVAEHTGVRSGHGVAFEKAEGRKADEAEFIMLRDGTIGFEGNAAELRASTDAYIRTFLS